MELCGALKNIVAIGAGFVDGLGYGTNTKAAIIRIGMMEMVKFCKKYYTGISVRHHALTSVLCGVCAGRPSWWDGLLIAALIG